MDRGGKLRLDWNRCLLEDVIVLVFLVLFVEVSKYFGYIVLCDFFWFCGNFVEFWLVMVKWFYFIVVDFLLFYIDVGGGRWIIFK